MVPPKLSVSVLPIAAWWTTTWITVPPKLYQIADGWAIWWTTAWFTVPPKRMERPALICKGELLLDLWYLRDWVTRLWSEFFGELLLGLRYFRNTGADGRITCKGELLLDLRCLRNWCHSCWYFDCGWTTTWITVPPKRWFGYVALDQGWTTAWFMAHPKLTPHSAHLIRRWTTTWITVPPKRVLPPSDPIDRWTTTWITVPPKLSTRKGKRIEGELLLGLPYLRNRYAWRIVEHMVNYYLDYRTSETGIHKLASRWGVNYYLDYRTSETEQ